MDSLNAEIVEIQKSVATILEDAPKAIAITNYEDVVRATEFLGMVKSRMNKVEELRTFFVGPLNDQVKNINAMFKAQIEPLNAIIASVKRAIAAYTMEEAKKARIEEERLAKLREKQNERREEKGLDPITTPLPIVAPPKQTVKTETAKTTTVKVWKFRVLDVNVVPREYLRCEVKHADVQRAISGGVREIAGLEIYEDVEVRITA